MRVPNTGLDSETRAIIREGYRLAERLMRDHRDPPGFFQALIAECRQLAMGLYRAALRG